MDSLLQNLRATRRRLRKSPGFTAAIVLTLGLGVGVNTAMFSVVHAVLLAPLPYPDAEKLTFIGIGLGGEEGRRPLSGPELVELASESSLHTGLGGVWPTVATLVEDGRPEPLRVAIVTANFLSLLGTPPLRGRLFRAADEGPGASPVVIISGQLWQSRFGGADVIGRRIRLDGGWGFSGGSYTVIGVMPASFEMVLPLDATVPTTADVWIPFEYDLSAAPRSTYFLRVIGRVAPGATMSDAQQQFEQVGDALMKKYSYRPGRRFSAVPLSDDAVKKAKMPLLILQAAVLAVLLIACANIVNLVLVRAQAQRKEISIRLALGASPRRLAAPLLTESLVLAAAGGLVGLALAYVCLRVLPTLTVETLPRVHAATLNLPVLGYSFLMTMGCGVLFGVTALVQARRGDTVSILARAGQGSSDVSSRRGRQAFVVAELGLALVLLIGAGLLLRTFLNLHAIQPGYRWEQVLTFKLSLPVERYSRASSRLSRFARELEARLRAVPGVVAAGEINQLPLEGTPNWATPYRTRTAGKDVEARVADARLVTPGYFEALQAELVKGRWITDRDDETQPLVLMVDELLARKTWPGAEPLGEELSVQVASQSGFSNRWGRVVGVVRHLRHHQPSEEVREQVFIPFAQAPRNQMAVVVRSAVEPAALMRDISRQIAAIDPELAASQVQLLAEYVARKEAPARFTMVLSMLLAALSLLLACLGVYGVLSYGVAQRAPELGIRAALGAGRGALVGMVLRSGAALTSVGLILGLLAAVAMGRWMQGLLFGVTALDAATFSGAAVLLGLTALLACYIPARRAAAADPLRILRTE